MRKWIVRARRGLPALCLTIRRANQCVGRDFPRQLIFLIFRKYSPFTQNPNHLHNSPVLLRLRGVRTSRTLERDAMDAAVSGVRCGWQGGLAKGL